MRLSAGLWDFGRLSLLATKEFNVGIFVMSSASFDIDQVFFFVTWDQDVGPRDDDVHTVQEPDKLPRTGTRQATYSSQEPGSQGCGG